MTDPSGRTGAGTPPGGAGAPRLAVFGEALIDLHRTPGEPFHRAYPGGSPLNVAVGLGRLGLPTLFVGRFSRDAFGGVLRRHAAESGVDTSRAVLDTRPSTVALFQVDAAGVPSYEFHVEGAVDWYWTDDELDGLPAGLAVAHFGSLASWLPPGDDVLRRRLRRLREQGVLVSYDPNIRPLLFPGPDEGRRRVEAAVALADIVKVSQEDLDWLCPGEPALDVARRWLALGPRMVVLTHGPHGADCLTRHGPPLHVPGLPVRVRDTVGAGDAFTSGLLAALADQAALDRPALDRLTAAPTRLAAVLRYACAVAAATCAREGADPPRRDEVGVTSATLERR